MRRCRSLLFSAVLLSLALAAGCRSQSTPATGAWKLLLVTAPAPPTSQGETHFTLHVTDSRDQPIGGATASIDLIMTTMDMGPNHVALAPQGNGVYVGRGQFGMAGPWNARVTVQRPGHSQIQAFPFQVQ